MMKSAMRNNLLKVLAVIAIAVICIAVGSVASVAKADGECKLTMRSGACVRVGEASGTGIRYLAAIDENLVEETADGYKFKDGTDELGVIIVPSKALEGASGDLFDYLENTYGKAKSEISKQLTDGNIRHDANGYYAACAIVDIKAANLALKYQAVPYTKTAGVYYYGECSDAKTISGVFNSALNDTSDEELHESVLAKAIEMNASLKIDVEGNITDGVDLSNYTSENYSIASITLKGEDVDIDENQNLSSLQKTDAGLDSDLVITYTNDKTLTVKADVWSLIINDATDLFAMRNYAYQKQVSQSGMTSYATYGYYKVGSDFSAAGNNVNGSQMVATNNDTTVSGETWHAANVSYGISGFQGVFDGDGHTISNLTLQYRSLFGVIGYDAIFRNVNFANLSYYSPKNTAYLQTALLGSWVNGGTVENVNITYNLSANYNTLVETPNFCGLLFGRSYLGGAGGIISHKIVLDNVSIRQLNEGTVNANFAVLGEINSTLISAWASSGYFDASNVLIIGAAIYGDSSTMQIVSETDGVEHYEAYLDYEYPLISTQEMEVGDTVDFETITGKEISSITLNGDEVATSITYAKTDASDIAKRYCITYADGMKNSVKITVWSLIIDNADELFSMRDYAYQKQVLSGNNTFYATYGYYKVGSDFDATGYNVNGNQMLATNSNTTVNGETWHAANVSYGISGFQGVFDGDGHTISNLTLQYRSLFGVIGYDAIFRNVNFANLSYYSPKNTAYLQTALLGSWVNGGTVENVNITYNLSANYNTLVETPNFCGLLFGRSYLAGAGGIISHKIVLDNVSIRQLNEGTVNANFAVLGEINSSRISAWESSGYFDANNVLVIGAAIYGDSSTMQIVSETDGVEYYEAYLDYEYPLISTQEMEVGDTVDFEAITGKEISSITLNGDEVATSITYAKTDASDVAKLYCITNADGTKNSVKITVWSLIIDNADELFSMRDYAYQKQITNAQGVSSYATYGYYKVGSDFDATGYNVNGNQMVATLANTTVAGETWYAANHQFNDFGFQGVFDGAGRTISNLTLQYRSLFGVVGKDAIFRNVNFTNVSYYGTKNTAYTQTALLGSWVNGGTVENVSITYNLSANYNTIAPAPAYCGLLFGQLYLGNNSAYVSKIVLKNVTITQINNTTNDKFAVLGTLTQSAYTGWASTGYFDATNVSITGAAVYGDASGAANAVYTSGTGIGGITYNALS